ncbi:MAG: putative porin [bacterium]|nr:putative porin [bacterium]
MMKCVVILLFVGLLPGLAGAGDDLPYWLVNTKLSGDFRYRNEGIDSEGNQARYRNRIRYRLGLETGVNEKVSVGARFASGAGEARSTNQDLQYDLSAKPIHLDRAYMEVKPSSHWWVTAGKYANPFVTTDLHWDSDVNFEGGAFRWTAGEQTVLSATGAESGWNRIRAVTAVVSLPGNSLQKASTARATTGRRRSGYTATSTGTSW